MDEVADVVGVTDKAHRLSSQRRGDRDADEALLCTWVGGPSVGGRHPKNARPEVTAGAEHLKIMLGGQLLDRVGADRQGQIVLTVCPALTMVGIDSSPRRRKDESKTAPTPCRVEQMQCW